MAQILSRSKIVAIIDVGSGYVGCALLSVAHTGASRILAYGHSPLALDERSGEQARARIAEEIAAAAQAAQATGADTLKGKHITGAYVILHAPWTTSKVASASEALEKQTQILASHIGKLAQASLAQSSLDTSRLFERSVISVRLNGYPTAAPEGKRAQTIDVASLASECDPAIKQTIETAVHAAFPATTLAWVSADRAHAEIARRVFREPDVLLVGVGITATHLTVLREGVPISNLVVPEGLQGILARVHGKEAPQETLALFRMYARDACESDACTALRTAVAAAEPEMVKVFGEYFAKLAEGRRLPNTLALVAHPDVALWLAAFFERIDFAQFTLTTMPFVSRVIDMPSLSAWTLGDEHVDAPLAVAAAFIGVEEQST